MDIGHHPAAVLLRNGEIIAMCEEERFVRVKEAPGLFPLQAIQFCLGRAAIGPQDLAGVGWNWSPEKASERSRQGKHPAVRTLASLLQFGLRHTPLRTFAPALANGFLPERVTAQLRSQLFYWLGLGAQTPLYCFDHHLAHAASAFFASGREKATIVSWDCWGDHLSGMIARGDGSSIDVIEELPFARFSIGKLNDFVYEFLRTSEKGNLMGLAPYGTATGVLDDLVDSQRLTMRMDLLAQHAPFPPEFLQRAGQPRRPGEPIEQRHKDLAADLQRHIETFGMRIVETAVRETGLRDICFAGGCALNATMNGKIGRSGLVDNVFIQPEAGDAGGALGAAYLAHLQAGQPFAPRELTHAYWGPTFSNEEIIEQVELVKVPYELLSDADLAPCVSEMLADQKIIGWFQLGSEWGPRALGARSIIADPRREEMRDRVNSAIKYRDWWRPFAPSMLAEAADEYLDGAFFAPFMVVTFPVKRHLADTIAGVVHRDGTTRPQMVRREINPRYYDVIKAFGERTGVPMILNTSFNLKGEPMVNTPRDALRTFFSSGLDALVMNNVLVRKDR
ncbi:MAG TPA: carbamoyltransferase C-terminal domain-containing protein [Candidatus Dormibacteraeota bacterium]|nr:carbamoyltransferase C-terminal domain-containing protein [Candidatus Dormibacteraeota bacterium]